MEKIALLSSPFIELKRAVSDASRDAPGFYQRAEQSGLFSADAWTFGPVPASAEEPLGYVGDEIPPAVLQRAQEEFQRDIQALQRPSATVVASF